MKRLICAESVAVVGASPDLTKTSGRPVAFLKQAGYDGDIYLVNPRHDDIDGLRCYPSVTSIPAEVDAALILVPADKTPDVVRQCGERHIPFAISIASGFAEAGQLDLQQELLEVAQASGVRLVGPNSAGLIVPHQKLPLTFSSMLSRHQVRTGGTVLLTQSGALGNACLDLFERERLGMRLYASTGNEVDLDVLDFAEYAVSDHATTAIAMIVESFKNGARFEAIAQQARDRDIPIVVMRGGQSARSREVSHSHTGKMAGSAAIWASVAKATGVISVDGLDELADACRAFSLPPVVSGSRADGGLAVLSTSGGLGVFVADACEMVGVQLARLTQSTVLRLEELVPTHTALGNPIDVARLPSTARYLECADATLRDPEVSVLLLMIASNVHDYGEITDGLIRLAGRAAEAAKGIAVSYLSPSDQLDEDSARRLALAGVLVHARWQRVVSLISNIRYSGHRVAEVPLPTPESAGTADVGASSLNSEEVGRLLAEAGISLPDQVACDTAAAAVTAAEGIGFPVALKLAASVVDHKFDVGGVQLDLHSADAVRTAWAAIESSLTTVTGQRGAVDMVVQKMVQGGVELIVGCLRDAEFGPVVMVGSGGIWTEVARDVVFQPLPVDLPRALQMIESLRVYRILEGKRRAWPMDVQATARAIVSLSQMYQQNLDVITEIEINPLIVLPVGAGVCAVDVLAK